MTRVAHIQPNATGGRPPEGKAVVPEAAWGVVGWKAPATGNRLFHSALNTPSPGRGGLGRGFSAGIANDLWEMVIRNTGCAGFNATYLSMEQNKLESIGQSTNQSDPEPNWYIYHSDHLGSSAFLTDASGDPTQHLQYMPFGETFIEQRSTTSYYTPYTFSAKERDTETGYSYFGARYYDAEISVWLSVDPMADKHPDYTPFAYVYNSPLCLIDPFGYDSIPFRDGTWGWRVEPGNSPASIALKTGTSKEDLVRLNYGRKFENGSYFAEPPADGEWADYWAHPGENFRVRTGDILRIEPYAWMTAYDFTSPVLTEIAKLEDEIKIYNEQYETAIKRREGYLEALKNSATDGDMGAKGRSLAFGRLAHKEARKAERALNQVTKRQE